MLIAGALFTPAFWIFFGLIRLAGKTGQFFKYGLGFWLLTTVPLLFFRLLPGPIFILVLTYTALWVLALNVLAALANSVTLHMLSELLSLHRASFSSEQIKQTYDQTAALQGRLHTIVQSGLIHEKQKSYTVTRKGKLVAAPFETIKRLFKISRIG
jgi:hypothetical protein